MAMVDNFHFRRLKGKINLNNIREAGIETSLGNIAGCEECAFKEKCIFRKDVLEKGIEEMEKKYEVLILVRCPLLMIEEGE